MRAPGAAPSAEATARFPSGGPGGNRANRRVRAAGEPIVAAQGRPGWDYVLIARAEVTASRPFDELQADLRWAMEQVHTARAAEKKRRGSRFGQKRSG